MEHHDEYDDVFVAGLEWMWGEGFLSPGGIDEVRTLIATVPVANRTVLDIGCGTGGIDVALVSEFGARHVTGIDIEQPLVNAASARASAARLDEHITIQRVTAGPLPFDENSYDIVFSKDSLIHVPDKAAIYGEIFRVLRPGGHLVYGDWFGSKDEPTPEFEQWLRLVDLSFRLGPIEEACWLLSNCGFELIESVDRNAWYAAEMVREVAMVSGDNQQTLAEKIGPEAARQRLTSSSAKKRVVDQGQLRPGHIRALKPG